MLLVTASIGRVDSPPAPPPRVFGNFVELRGGALFLDGKPFHFVGTNIYWLMTKAAQRNYELVEQVLDEGENGPRSRTAFWLGAEYRWDGAAVVVGGARRRHRHGSLTARRRRSDS